jgi:cysteine desulfurase family protein (TIGR01976 family)
MVPTHMSRDPREAARQARIRAEFPAFAGDTIFLENAGGSQVPACVSDAMRDYLRESYVQIGATYPLSRRATRIVEEAHAFARMFGNAQDHEAILGASTTALLNMLAASMGRVLEPGQEIILAETGHEANLGPWKRLAQQGLIVRWWRMDPVNFRCPIERLRELLSPRTALVALPHVSNLLGSIVDLADVTAEAHRAGAAVVADGVAYAPHRAIDLARWGVDWYVYSAYKVYGPHMAVLYGKPEALAALPGANHFFVPESQLVYKFEPGGPNHEACAGLLALGEYLRRVAGAEVGSGDGSAVGGVPAAETARAVDGVPEQCHRPVVERAYARMESWERPLLELLIGFLRERPGVRLIGSTVVDGNRVGTVSFVHERKSSREIVAAVDRTEIAIRHGHMYAWHLCEALGLDPEDGVVRVSLVHYNSLEEIERLIEVLEEVL